MLVRPRKLTYMDVIPFPASKSAGALTINSDVMYDFTSNPGAVSAQLVASDTSKITDSLAVNLQVSYDGLKYYTVAEYSDLANGTGALSVLKESAVSFAPYIKLQGVFDSSGALAADHGCQVNVEIKEDENFYHFDIANDLATPFISLADSAEIFGDTVDFSDKTIYKVIGVVSGDSSKYTLVSIMLQSSYNGLTWWDVLDSAVDISDLNFKEVSATTKLGNYFRLKGITGETTGAIAEGHGTEVKIIGLSA